MSDSLRKFTLPDAVEAEQPSGRPAGGRVRAAGDRIGVAVWLAVVRHPRAVWAGMPGVVYLLALLYLHPSLHAFFIVGWRRFLLFDLPTLAAGVAAGWFGVAYGQRRLNDPHMGGSAAFAVWLFLGLILSFTVLILAVDSRGP